MGAFFKYLFYIIKHKWYVMIECFKVGLIWEGITHDWSKFLPDEWFPYMFNFYGTPAQKSRWHYKYDIAWLKHQKRNNHHWQYWVLIRDTGGMEPFTMPLRCIKHMVCDWKGAGKAITGSDNIKEWFDKNRDNMLLTDSVREVLYKEILNWFQ